MSNLVSPKTLAGVGLTAAGVILALWLVNKTAIGGYVK